MSLLAVRASLAEMSRLAKILTGKMIPVKSTKRSIAFTDGETAIYINFDNVLFQNICKHFLEKLISDLSPEQQVELLDEVPLFHQKANPIQLLLAFVEWSGDKEQLREPRKHAVAVLKGLDDHECGHVLFTDNKAWVGGIESAAANATYRRYVRLFKDLMNALEDHRINRCMAVMYPGSRKFIRLTYEWAFKDYEHPPLGMKYPPGIFVFNEAHQCLATGKQPIDTGNPALNEAVAKVIAIGEEVRMAPHTNDAVYGAFKALDIIIPLLPDPSSYQQKTDDQENPGTNNPQKAPDGEGDYRKIRVKKKPKPQPQDQEDEDSPSEQQGEDQQEESGSENEEQDSQQSDESDSDSNDADSQQSDESGEEDTDQAQSEGDLPTDEANDFGEQDSSEEDGDTEGAADTSDEEAEAEQNDSEADGSDTGDDSSGESSEEADESDSEDESQGSDSGSEDESQSDDDANDDTPETGNSESENDSDESDSESEGAGDSEEQSDDDSEDDTDTSGAGDDSQESDTDTEDEGESEEKSDENSADEPDDARSDDDSDDSDTDEELDDIDTDIGSDSSSGEKQEDRESDSDSDEEDEDNLDDLDDLADRLGDGAGDSGDSSEDDSAEEADEPDSGVESQGSNSGSEDESQSDDDSNDESDTDSSDDESSTDSNSDADAESDDSAPDDSDSNSTTPQDQVTPDGDRDSEDEGENEPDDETDIDEDFVPEEEDLADVDQLVDDLLRREHQLEQAEKEQAKIENQEDTEFSSVNSDTSKYGNLHKNIKVETRTSESYLYDTSTLERQASRMEETVVRGFEDMMKRKKSRYRTRLLEGEIDPIRLVQDEFGDDRIFRQPLRRDKTDMVVVSMTDESGSMSIEGRYAAATGANLMLHGVLRRINVPHQQFGFSAFAGRNAVLHRPYVLFENCNQPKLPICCGSFDNARDGMSIRLGAQMLLQRPERQKLLIVISDGMPEHGAADHMYTDKLSLNDTAEAVREAERQGVRVVGVSIGEDDNHMATIYQNRVCVKRLSELPQKLVSVLKQTFQ